MSEQEHVVSMVRSTADVVQQQQLGEATSQIQYDSNGHALIIGSASQALAVASAFKTNGMTVVEVDPELSQTQKQLTDDGVAVFSVPALTLSGHLGAYRASVPATRTEEAEFDLGVSVYLESGCFDVVLDLSPQAHIPLYLSPFGYRHASSEQDIADAVAELSDMKGEFDKPRYFNYNQSICAHSRSELDGCQRCLDVCAAGAITSKGEGITVDPFLCQGCGSCATVCPSGAMSYAYPRPANAIERSRQALTEAGASILLLHTEAHKAAVDAANLPATILPLEVEEVSAFGIDYWLSMLAGFACRIVLLSDAQADDPNRQAMLEQMSLLQELLQGVGVAEQAVVLSNSALVSDDISGSVLDESSWNSSMLKDIKPAEFATHNDKRQTIRLALDALSEQLTATDKVVPLAPGAPFGRVIVDQQSCTLCLSCVSICPAKALQEGQDTPALRFVEANCLQCGLCETACPESAISLQAQYVWDSISARQRETLHEEEPFHCLVCHTPFTTRAMMNAMTEKLSGHWMFQDSKAMRRMKMCGDCRVRDMFEEDRQGIDVHPS